MTATSALPLVLGTWALGGAWSSRGQPRGYRHLTEADAFDVLDAAWDEGIRWLDTAPAYGDGTANRRVAKWQALRGRQWKTVVKLGRPIVDGLPSSRLGQQELREEFAEQVSVLGPPAGVLIKDPPEETFRDRDLSELLSSLCAAAPSAHTGFTVHDGERTRWAPTAPSAQDVVQLDLNGVNWRSSVPAARELSGRGWRVWAMCPLAYGFLARLAWDPDRFGEDDWRSRLPASTTAATVALARSFYAALAPSTGGARPATVAVAFCLACGPVERVIIGPRNRTQLHDSPEALVLAHEARFVAAVEQLVSQPPLDMDNAT